MSGPEFASGRHAFGFCDRCGFRYDLSALKWEFEDKRRNGLRVCPECLDPDHPQLQLGRFRIYDPQSLKNPRPDLNLVATNALFGWNPVGDESLIEGTGQVGTVTVTTE